MSKKTYCDGCGIVLETPALTFDIDSVEPPIDGELRWYYHPERLDWGQSKTEGHLCPQCAQGAIAELNDVVKDATA